MKYLIVLLCSISLMGLVGCAGTPPATPNIQATITAGVQAGIPLATPPTNAPTCKDLFPEAKEVPAREYILNLDNSSREISENSTYWYISPSGSSVAKNGPAAY